MPLADRARPLTYADYLAIPEDDRRLRYEILDGELYVTASPRIRHQAVSRNLQRVLDRHIVEYDLGLFYSAPVDVVLSDTTVAVPDMVFIRRGREDIIHELAIEGAPDLVVEILSPSTASRDRVLKARLYAQLGVPEYWIVDPVAETLDVYIRQPSGEFGDAVRKAHEETLTTERLPGLTIPLAEVWASR